MVAAAERKMSFPSIRDFAKEAGANESTIREHLPTLVQANVLRRDPISLNPDHSTWDISVLIANRARKAAAPTSRQEIALVNLWVAESLRRLESQFRGADFLRSEPVMQEEAEALRRSVVDSVLKAAPDRLDPVRNLLPSGMLPAVVFPDFYSKPEPLVGWLREIVPDISDVIAWLRELKAILSVRILPAHVTQ